MNDSTSSKFITILLVVAFGHLVAFAYMGTQAIIGAQGLLLGPAGPIGGDFVNLLTAAKLLVSGQIEQIYAHEQFMAFQRSIIDAEIGLRLWAYPPHSLFFIAPFAFLGFFPSLILWSALGVGVLTLAARRFGFSWRETGLVVLSPAVLYCVILGQTGNLATALLLLALSSRNGADKLSIGAAALLTIKPQTGFLLPVIWLIRRQWRLLISTGVLVLALIIASLVIFGVESWRAYFFDSATILSELEKFGTGPFMRMVPSTFMSLRILGMEGSSALNLHAVFAVIVGGVLVWRLMRTQEADRQNIILFLGICLITPYLHHYDLSILVCAAVLMLRQVDSKTRLQRILTYTMAVFAWGLPHIILVTNALGLPIAPLGILAMFALV